MLNNHGCLERGVKYCPICGTEVSEERPQYNVLLEFSGQTRSAAKTDNPTSTKNTGRFQRQLCTECWEDLYEELASDSSEEQP